MNKIIAFAALLLLSPKLVCAQFKYDSFLNLQFNYCDSDLIKFNKIQVTTLCGSDTNHLMPVRQQIYMNGFLYNDIQGDDITNRDSIDKELTFSYDKDKTIQSVAITYYPSMFKTNNGEILKYDLKGEYLGPKFGHYNGGNVSVVLKPEKISENYNYVTYDFRYYNTAGKLLDQDTLISGNPDRIIKIDSVNQNNYLIISKRLKGSFVKEYYKRDSLRFSERWDTAEDGTINKFTDTVGKILEMGPNSPCCYYKYINEYNLSGRKISDEYFEYVHGYVDEDKQEYINNYLTEYDKDFYYSNGKVAIQDKYDYDTDHKLLEHTYQHFMPDKEQDIDASKGQEYYYKKGLLTKVVSYKTDTHDTQGSYFYYYYKYEILK